MQQIYAGFDLGGTKLLYGLADQNGRFILKEKIQIDHTKDINQVVIDCLEKCRKYSDQNNFILKSAGLGVPGVCGEDQIFLNPNLKNIDLKRIKVKANLMGIRFSVMNDVRCALLGERWLGAAKGVDDVIYINLGTGLSCAFLSGGNIIKGYDNAAGEIAYMLSNEVIRQGIGFAGCFDPDNGSLENAIAGRALDGKAKAIYKDNANQTQETNAKMLFDSAIAGEKKSTNAINEFAEELASAVVQMSVILNPRLIVFGGSVSKNFELFYPVINKYLSRYLPYLPELSPARLGPDAGLLGCIYLSIHNKTD